MSIRKILIISLVIFVGFAVSSSQMRIQTNGTGIVAGRNVNMVSVDPNLQRQNEPSIAVSTSNPNHLIAGANDYSLIDYNGDEVGVTHDAWLGVFKSFDGGESWEHDLVPPYEGVLAGASPDTIDPLYGYDAAADPTIRAGIDGWFFYNGIAFDRKKNGDSVIFVARYQDTGSDIVYRDTSIIDSGTSGQFSDKPWIAVDPPRSGNPNGVVYIAYSIFLGSGKNIHSQILISRSLDGGKTWERPVKVSEGEQKNQGTTLAVDPIEGRVYVAWRRFASPSAPDGILISKSEDFGQTWSKAEEVATIFRPFDQSVIGGAFPNDPSQFRSSAFPSITVDHSGRIYLAWSQRDVNPSFPDDARIVITSLPRSSWGAAWPDAEPVDKPDGISSDITIPNYPAEVIHSHQFMPSLTYGAGKLVIVWYDNRYSARVFNQYGELRNDPGPYGESTIEDPADRMIDGADECPYRETIDVRAAIAEPGDSPQFEESIQVSRFLWVLENIDNNEVPYLPRQIQFNPPNYKLFAGGTLPFIGDYIDVTPTPTLIEEGGSWRFSQEGDPFVFYTAWTDNRDVLPPDNNVWNNLVKNGNCDGVTSGRRNQNIYVSKITFGIEIDVRGTFVNEEGNKQVFVISVNNKTDVSKDFQLQIINQPETVSFFPGEAPEGQDPQKISVEVPYHSSISRMVFVPASSTYPVQVQVSEQETGTFTDSLFLSLESSPSLSGATSITEMDVINWQSPTYLPQWYDSQHPERSLANPNILGPNILGPNILGPNILGPNILGTNILSPNILGPNILGPNILGPNILGPNILGPNILGPNILGNSILNPNILGPSMSSANITNNTAVVDKIWEVTNETNAVVSYTFKSIAGTSIPDDAVYTQLLIFKAHELPGSDGCSLKNQVQHELLVNIINHDIIDSVDLNDIKKLVGDPQLEFDNATFSLESGESALVMLRVIDTNPSRPWGQGKISKMEAGAPIQAQSQTAEDFTKGMGAVVVSHTSTGETPVSAITLMIIPTTIPPGKAGESYASSSIRALGGTPPYFWQVIEVIDTETGLPLTGIAGNEIVEGLTFSQGDVEGDDPDYHEMILIPDPNPGASIIPRRFGDFLVTIQVSDAEGEADTKTFSLHIDPPPPLVISMNQNPSPATMGTEYDGGGTVFTVSGGIPPYHSWILSPGDLGLGLTPSGDNGETAALSGIPLMADYFEVETTVKDSALPESILSQPLVFNICIRPPAEFDVVAVADEQTIDCPEDSTNPCELPTGSLGKDYSQNNVTLATNNHQPGTTLEWTISGDLPPGLSLNPSLDTFPASFSIQGSPMFDGDPDYPKTYIFTVTATETWTFNEACSGSRTAERTFSINVNPKEPDWSVESALEGVATAMTSDSAGNVYVTGYTNGENKDYYTAKIGFNAETGKWEEVWSKTYDGPGKGEDISSDIIVYENLTTGKVIICVTGTSDGGEKKSGPDIYTVAYDPTQASPKDVVWDDRYDGPSHFGDGGNALAIDAEGNVYVTGYVHRGQQHKHADYCTLKYDSSGNLLWDETYDSRRNGNDIATAIAVDTAGNVYVTGKSQESLTQEETTHDFFTIKYDSSGALLWEARDDGPGFGDDEPKAIHVNEAGTQVYVTGLTTGGTLGSDYYTVKYDASGNPLWGNSFNGSGNGDDTASALAVDFAGNIYVTGKSFDTTGFDYATVKYDSSGNQVWQKSYDGEDGDDEAFSLAFDEQSGSVYVAGFITTTATGTDYFTIKYDDESGDIIWIARYPLPETAQGDQKATAIIVTADGVFVTGSSNINGSMKFLTLKYTK